MARHQAACVSKFVTAWTVVACFAFCSQSAFAAARQIKWSAPETPVSAARGETIKVALHGEIPEGFHTYSTKTYKDDGPMPTEITVGPDKIVALNGAITYPKPKIEFDKGFKIDVETFEKEVTFTVPVMVLPDVAPGDHEITFKVTSQICNENSCLPPVETELKLKLKVTDAAPVKGAVATPPKAPSLKTQTDQIAVEISKAKSEGLAAYLWLAFVAGATALLTPCVFPMIPITVSFFTKRKHISRSRAIRDAGIYSIGIISTFTGLGFVFALFLGATGITDFATNPWVNLFVAGVFILLAGSLFGFYEIQLPTSVLNKLNAKANEGEGILSVLLMGLVFSLTSFTCTVPFVGGVMVSATQGDWLWPLLGMLVFSSVFSLPFFLLALFPAALKSLPKSGGWLNSVKVVMGFLEIAAAMKFLSNADIVWQWELLTRNVFLLIWIALAVMTVLYLIGRIKFVHDSPVEKMSGFRMLTATGFVSIALFLATGLFGAQLGILEAYVPSRNYASSNGWIENFEEGLKKAKASGKPIFVDFTGYTCTNCRLMEENMFPRSEVAPLLDQYVRVRLHTDGRKNQKQIEENRANQKLQQERYHTTALPYYAIISPDGADLGQFDGLTYDVDKFTTFLKQGLSEKSEPKVAQTK